MSLTCYCDYDWDGEGWAYGEASVDFIPFPRFRRKACASCAQLIGNGDDCLEFKRFQYPQDEIKQRILGEDYEIALASDFLCAACGEIYLNLEALGYECLNPRHGMQKYLEEYHDLTGWIPGKGPGVPAAT